MKNENKRLLIFLILTVLVTSIFFAPLYASHNPEQTAENLEKKGIHPLLITGLISLLPIFELRGGIPVGIALFKQKILAVYFISVIFNLIPILPILYLLVPIRNFFIRHNILKGFFTFLNRKAEKNSKIVEKYGEFGLALFVAIPLPITGAWTGSIIAIFMGLSPVKSFLFITIGVFSAGIIVTVITAIGMKMLILIVPIILALVLLILLKFLKEKKGEGKKDEC